MKKLLSLILGLSLMLTLAGCGKEKPTTPEKPVEPTTKQIEKSANGYGGEVKVKVTFEGEKMTDLEVVSHAETAPVFDRAMPILEERILKAQSPIVDNVSGATFSSWAVKKAVADACKENGKDFGEITMTTVPAAPEKKQLEDVTTDLVVVGGGPAGLAAAITAKESGVENVILIEKMDILSGNGKFDMNFFDLYRSEATIAAGTDMTKEEFIESKKNYRDGMARIERWADEAYTLDEWLRGYDITLDYTYGVGNHMHNDHDYAGDHIQKGLEKAAYDLGVEIRTGNKGTDLIMTDGVATGVKVETKEGNYNINAKAVIIATGGFANNAEYIEQYAPSGVGYINSNQMSTTGDFIPVFIENDIKLGNMDNLSMFTNILYPRRDLTGGADLYFRVNKDGVKAEENSEPATYITDKGGYDSFYRIRKHVDANYYKTFNTLDELAKEFGIDAEGLKKTIDDYNKTTEGRKFAEEGPYYAATVVKAIHMTKGGVVANENAQVINNSDQVVPGLYAAGEVTDTQGAYSCAVVFGKVAGEEAAKYISAE